MKGKRILELALVVLFIVAGLIITRYLIVTKKAVKKKPPEEMAIPVKAQRVEPRRTILKIMADGEVMPSKVVQVVPQVSGKVVFVAEQLKKGGLLKKDQIILKIDDRDYRIRLAQAEAELKKAEAELAQIKADREAALKEWRMVNPTEPPPALVAKEPQLKAARAAVLAAKASVKKAELDLERTILRAPFDSVVLEENVDVGQYVFSGQALARLGSSEVAEVRVYVSETDTAWLRIPGFNTTTPSGTKATIEATIGGTNHTWHGRITRAEPVDTRTRRLPLVVEVEAPYKSLPPLAFGLYVRLTFQGPEIPSGAFISKRAIEWDQELNPYVWIIRPDGRVEKRPVKIVQEYEKEVLISEGLHSGEYVTVDPPTLLTEGTRVKVVEK